VDEVFATSQEEPVTLAEKERQNAEKQVMKQETEEIIERDGSTENLSYLVKEEQEGDKESSGESDMINDELFLKDPEFPNGPYFSKNKGNFLKDKSKDHTIIVEDEEAVVTKLGKSSETNFMSGKLTNGSLYVIEIEDLQRLRHRPRDRTRCSWLTNSIVDYVIYNILEQFFPNLVEAVTLLPALYDPHHGVTDKYLKEIIMWPSLINNHFCLIIYSSIEKVIYVFDSLNVIDRNTPALMQFKNNLEQISPKILIKIPRNVPKQQNLNDCGIYCILYAEHLFEHIATKATLSKVKFAIQKDTVLNKRRMIFDLLRDDYMKSDVMKHYSIEDIEAMW